MIKTEVVINDQIEYYS